MQLPYSIIYIKLKIKYSKFYFFKITEKLKHKYIKN